MNEIEKIVTKWRSHSSKNTDNFSLDSVYAFWFDDDDLIWAGFGISQADLFSSDADDVLKIIQEIDADLVSLTEALRQYIISTIIGGNTLSDFDSKRDEMIDLIDERMILIKEKFVCIEAMLYTDKNSQ
jgi:hypothetical protein